MLIPEASSLEIRCFIKQVNPLLAKRPLKTNGRLANRWLTSLVKEAKGVPVSDIIPNHGMNYGYTNLAHTASWWRW